MARLEPEQDQVLSVLVEAHRNVAPEDRSSFFSVNDCGDRRARLVHPGLKRGERASTSDLRILHSHGYILARECDHQGNLAFEVTPEGIEYYHQLRKMEGSGTQRVEKSVETYLKTTDFRLRHPKALALWLTAEAGLQSADSTSDHTRIGHSCRESMQEFATSCLVLAKNPQANADPSKTVDRLRSAISSLNIPMSDKRKLLLDAIVVYWGTLSDLVQRQEHGSQKEGQSLVWEDSRITVFQTANVMFELDRALNS